MIPRYQKWFEDPARAKRLQVALKKLDPIIREAFDYLLSNPPNAIDERVAHSATDNYYARAIGLIQGERNLLIALEELSQPFELPKTEPKRTYGVPDK